VLIGAAKAGLGISGRSWGRRGLQPQLPGPAAVPSHRGAPRPAGGDAARLFAESGRSW